MREQVALISRRALSAALPLTALAGTAPASAAANSADEDAELLDLGRQWQAYLEEAKRLADRLYEAEDRTIDPPYPEAMYFQSSDLRLWYCSPKQEIVDGLPIGRKIYFADHSRDYIKLFVEKAREEGDTPHNAAIIARATEIHEAFDQWEKEREANNVRTGLIAALTEIERATKAGTEIRRRIVLATARTLKGIFVKAALARWCCSDDDEAGMEEIFQVAFKHDELVCGDAGTISLLRDVLAMASRQEGSET